MRESFNNDISAIDGYSKKLVKALPEALGEIRVPADRFMLNGLDVQVSHGTSGDFHDFTIEVSTGVKLGLVAIQAIEDQPWAPGHRIKEYCPAKHISFAREWSIDAESELVCHGWIESYSRELAHLDYACDPDNVEHFDMVARVLAAVLFDASSAARDADLLKDAREPLERIARLGDQPQFVKTSDSKDGLWTGSLGPHNAVAIVGKPFIDDGERCCPVTVDLDEAALPTMEEEHSMSERLGDDEGEGSSFYQQAWKAKADPFFGSNQTQCESGWRDPGNSEFRFYWYPDAEDPRFSDEEGYTARLVEMTLKDLVMRTQWLCKSMTAASEVLTELAHVALDGGIRIERPSRR